MTKITKYLNEHLVGSVDGSAATRQRYSTDEGVLTVKPEFVVFPSVVNDIRKMARFSWQLAEKGHVLGVTARGLGGDTTGGAIGSGAVIDLSTALSSVLYVAGKEKNKLIHVEAGASLRLVHEVLRWHGLSLAAYTPDMKDMTIGGAVASGLKTYRSGKYGRIADAVERMEVVLANGDLMEVGRVTKRDVNKKRGEQTLEGEIYRQLDALLEDEAELIGKLSSDSDSIGYSIDRIKQKDGSYNLVPLFVASQGTLGIISEVVLKANYYSSDEAALVIACPTIEDAQDVSDELRKMSPSALILFNQAYLEAARAHGKSFIFDAKEAEPASDEFVVYASFDDFGSKARTRKLKRAEKFLAKKPELRFKTTETNRSDEVSAVRGAQALVDTPLEAKLASVAAADGAHVSKVRLSDFMKALSALAKKQRIDELPVSIDMISGIVSSRVMLPLKEVSGKQKVFKLAADYAKLVHEHGGSMASGAAEGRFGAFAAYAHVDQDIVKLNEKVRKIFDPLSTLNPGVKQKTDVKALVAMLKA